jgi:hypothetical protein
VIEWWPFVALGLAGLAVGAGFIYRAITGGPTKHEQSEIVLIVRLLQGRRV